MHEATLMELVSEDLSACRICLATNIPLYSIADGLGDKFVELMGVEFSEDDGLPQLLCPLCRALLLRAADLRVRCRRSQWLLEQALRGKPNLSTEDILSIDRDFYKLPLNLVQLNVYRFDSHKKNESRYIQKALLYDDSSCDRENLFDLKREVLISVREGTPENTEEYETVPKEKEIDNVEPPKPNKPNLLFEIDGSKMGWIKIKTAEPSSRDLASMREEYKMKIEEKEAKKKEVEAKKISTLIRAVAGKKKRAKSQKAKKVKDDIYEDFERKHECTLTILSMQEQLDEIAARKLTSNYLNPDYKCDFCGRGFEFEKTYKNHMAKHDPSNGKFECGVCHVFFRRGNLRQRHAEYHRMKFTCDICSFVTRARHSARLHYLMHTGKVYECKQCDARFTKSTSYLGHVRIHHPSKDAVCELCGDSFVGALGLRHHKARTHRVPQTETPKLKYECEICGVQFASLDVLEKHTDEQDRCDRSMKACAECGEVFTTEELLKQHADEKHLPVQYWCEECEQVFVSEASFDTHYQRVHLRLKGPAYGRTREMNLQYYHKLKERKKKKAPVVCEKCGAKITTKAALERHQAGLCRRPKKSKRPYKCPYCDKTCTTKPGVQHHMRTHTGERPYQCPDCPKTFAQQTNFVRHCKVVHLNQRDSFPCELCSKTFTTRYSVQLHVRTVHEKEPLPKRERKARTSAANV